MCALLKLYLNLIFLQNLIFDEARGNTHERITASRYKFETHQIETDDGYLLTAYRITDSPKNLNKFSKQTKPVILLLHGFALTSDAWVLGDPTQSLAFLLADAGYDVWLGNQRGNIYSSQHMKIQANENAEYWNFSWHEIGYYDLAAMFDYILGRTYAPQLHYVGYSQGTAVLLVLLSMRPEYARKLGTIHFLAPVAFMQNMRPPMAWLSGWFHTLGTALAHWFGYRQVLAYAGWPYYRDICEIVCGETYNLNFLCNGLFQFIGGAGSPHINKSLLPAICASHPAGASTKQILHFLQVYNSGKFEQFDYGKERNEQLYKAKHPPSYEIHKITNCIKLYYSENDALAAAKDVLLLADALRCAQLRRIQHTEWNHYDFLWSENVKDTLWHQIIDDIENS